MSGERTVVIEGIGGILSFNFLTPILAKFKEEFANNPQVKFYGADFDSKLTAIGAEAIKLLTSIGMIYVNKDSGIEKQFYDSIVADCVYIATPPHTHIPLVYQWLQRTNPPKVILVEKPFSEDVDEISKLLQFVQENSNITTRVLAFDHADGFRLFGEQLEDFNQFLGKISGMTFFWVHDLSGSDQSGSLYKFKQADHPNTRINRFNYLEDEKRQVFDALIHFFNPIEQMVDISTASLLQIKAAQYETSDISGETFVAVKLSVKSKQGDPIEARLYAGCSIGGIDSLKLSAGHMIILNNAAGMQVRINPDICKVCFIDSDGITTNEYDISPIYSTEMFNLFFGDPEMGHPIPYTLQCLEILDQIRAKINERLKISMLPQYRLGTANQKALSLEQVLTLVPPLGEQAVDLLDKSHLLELGKVASEQRYCFF